MRSKMFYIGLSVVVALVAVVSFGALSQLTAPASGSTSQVAPAVDSVDSEIRATARFSIPYGAGSGVRATARISIPYGAGSGVHATARISIPYGVEPVALKTSESTGAAQKMGQTSTPIRQVSMASLFTLMHSRDAAVALKAT